MAATAIINTTTAPPIIDRFGPGTVTAGEGVGDGVVVGDGVGVGEGVGDGVGEPGTNENDADAATGTPYCDPST